MLQKKQMCLCVSVSACVFAHMCVKEREGEKKKERRYVDQMSLFKIQGYISNGEIA